MKHGKTPTATKCLFANNKKNKRNFIWTSKDILANNIFFLKPKDVTFNKKINCE